MDLQAILDSADSSSSSSASLFSGDGKQLAGGDHNTRGSSSLLSSSNPSNSNSIGSYNDSYRGGIRGGGDGGGIGSEDAVDLEQILREDDEDDDDGVSSSTSGGGGGAGYMYDRRQRRLDDEELLRPKRLSSSRRVSSLSGSHSSINSNSSNPEEWDILQAILGEDDEDNDDSGDDYNIGDNYDHGSEYRSAASSSHRHPSRVYYGSENENENDDDDDDDILVSSSSSRRHRQQRQSKNRNTDVDTIRNNKQVDIILQQSDDDYENENDDDDEYGTRSSNKLRRRTYLDNNNNNDDDDDDDLVDVANVDSFMTAMQSEDSSEQLSNNKNDAINDNDNNYTIATTTSNEYANSTNYVPTPISSTTQQQPPPPPPKRRNQSNADNNNTRQNKSNVLFAKSDTELEKASRKALQVARAREAKLLKSTREARDNIVSPLTVKRRLKPKIELNTKTQQRQKELIILQQKEQQQQQQKQQSKNPSSNKAATSNNNSSSGPHFNFSGNVISMKQMQSVSKSLIERCCESNDDLPTAVGINSRFIGVGTQKGAILVYDHFEVLRQKLGGYYADSNNKDNKNNSSSSGDNNSNNNNVGGGDSNFNPKTAGSVTTVDLSLVQGEFLAAGYTGGNIVLWDVIKGIALKSLVETTPYPSPIVSVRFFASELKLVTVDAGGLVNKLNFSKNMLWSTYSVESECLLDGTAGQILAQNVLPPYQYVRQQLIQQASNNGNTAAAVQTKSLRSTMKKLVLIALSSERNSFVVAVEPSVHVLHRWLKPEPERIVGITRRQNQQERQAQVYLPCLSWGWALVNGGGHVINPILARAWGCCIQLLSASFPDLDEGGGGPTTNTTAAVAPEGFQYPAFGVHDEFDVDVPVVALEWLNDRSLVYLSMNNEFTVVDTVMMTLLERLDFSGLQLVYAEFSLSRKVAQKVEQKKPSSEAEYDSNNDDENSGVVESQAAPAPIKAETYFCTTFQNSFRSCDKRLMLLCQEELQSVSVVEARPRISGLENDGEWLEALALALDHYENTIKSQEDRKRDPKGYKDLSKHPGLRNGDGRTEDEEWIAKLLIRYLNIAVENAPETTNDFNFPPEIRQSQMDLARSHFQMLAGVCIEFCVVTKRLDLLFGPIFRRFHAAEVLSVFLDVLEPYILNDKLDYIAPEAMMHFVEHCRTNNGIATVERCLLHMDVTIMDFDTILNLLRANEMYSALFYIYNQGLNDYTTPLEILCESIFDAADTVGQLTNERRIDGISQNDFERFGYKAILYLQSTFRGRYFPKETEMPEECLHTVRPQLLRFLLQSRYTPSRSIKSPTQVIGQRALRYPYAHILLMVDPKAMFDTLSTAMDAPDEEFRHNGTNGIESIGGWEVEVGADTRSAASSTDSTSAPDRQEIIRMLLSIMMPSKDDITITHQTTLYRSQSAVNAFLDFLADYLMRGVIRTDKSVTFMILNRIATRFAAARDSEERKKWQGQIISLLSALPRSSYDSDAVLELVEKNGIHRASLLLHQEEASAWPHGDMTMERRGTHFCAAIDCYLDDDDPEYRKEVFSYVKKECSGASDEKDEQPNTLRNALISKLIDLVLLDALLTAELAADLFVDDPDQVIRSLDDEEAKFMFLKAVISGELNEMDSVAGSVLNAQLTTEHHHQYMALMVKLHPDMVYDYLSTHDNYRTEECLQLCQKYDIADASAYLLERMGNVTSALQLILQTMESRMMNLKRTIRGMGTDHFDKYYPRLSKHSRIPKRDRRLNPELYGKQEKEIDGLKRILTVALDVCERNSGSFSSRKETEHGSQLWFNVLDRLINAKGFLRLSKEQSTHAKVMAGVLSELLRLTMQRMVSSVPLPDLVRKVTSDHSGSRLGELREMIESLLITYGLELDVFGGAVSVFHYDSQQMEKSHHALRVRGSNVQSVMSIAMDNKSPSSAKAMTRFRNSNEILQLGGSSSHRDANIVVSTNPSSSHQRSRTSNNSKQERGLGDALSRLRSRRRDTNKNGDSNNIMNNTIRSASEMNNNNNNNNTRIRKATTGLNLMTSNEMAYRRGEISADATYFEDRQVGLLGEAEHRGRIMSFMY
jgi:hypothetical protein